MSTAVDHSMNGISNTADGGSSGGTQGSALNTSGIVNPANSSSAGAASTHERDAYDRSILDYATYEDYLDQRVKPEDLFYLEDPESARQIVELGYNDKDFLSREDFESAKRSLLNGPTQRRKSLDAVCSIGKDFRDQPFLHALAQREELVRNGKLSTILFIRYVVPPSAANGDKGSMEISGYIDYGHRLRTEEFAEYFEGKKILVPKPSDLSYYNWRTHTLYYNNSTTFHVIADPSLGLVFKHKRDRKTIHVDPRVPSPGDNSHRMVLPTSEYAQVTIYDHVTRRKN